MLTVVDPESGYGVASSFFKMQKRIEKERKKEREERACVLWNMETFN